MFPDRFRSHHDAEARLGAALGVKHNSRTAGVSWDEVEAALSRAPGGGRRCVYLHVPFCDKICSFCNLNRSERTGADMDAYADYLVSEIRRYAAYPYVREGSFQAVYFGGGTPTTLNEAQLSRVLRELKASFPLSADCEITLETTLHNLSPEKALRLRAEGATRFSVGVQTFSSRGRHLLGRTHDPAAAVERLAKLREVFDGTLGIDIIYSYPEQTLEEVAFDAAMTARLKADSASFYSLMIHDGSSLGKAIASGEMAFDRSLEEDRERHNLFYGDMRRSGYELLELSKLALPGRDEYRYIRIRYDGGDVLPLGQGAGGGLAGYRIYSMAPGKIFASKLDDTYSRYHRMFGLLQFGRYDAAALSAELGAEAFEPLSEKMAEFAAKGLLYPLGGGSYELTADGVFWGTNVAVEMLETAIAARGRKETVHA